MKFTKTLASIAAAAIAVSSLAVSAFAGSITFSDDAWWTQKDLKIEDILEGNKPEDVESITFTSDTTFFLGYNSTKVTDEKTGSTWKQDATAADTYTVSDAVLATQEIEGNTVNPAFSVMLSKGDGVDYTINWKVNLRAQNPLILLILLIPVRQKLPLSLQLPLMLQLLTQVRQLSIQVLFVQTSSTLL